MSSPARPDQRFAIGSGPWPAAESRVTRLVRLSNHGDYEDAARAAEALLAEGVHDVQVVVRAFFGTFLARGFAALPAVLGSLTHSLEGASASLGPPGGRPWMEVDVALIWLGRTIKDRIDFHQAQRDDIFKGWVGASDLALVEAIRVAVARLAGEVERALSGSRSLEYLTAIDAFVSGTLKNAVAKPPAPAPRRPPEPKPTPAAPPDADELRERAPPKPPPKARVRPAPPPESSPAAAYDSPALSLLKEKLAAFDALIERGEFARAAIVANDVNRVVESFDPRVYLPRLFASFYKRLAGSVDELAPYWQDAESFSSKALEHLYRVDLHAFLDDG